MPENRRVYPNGPIASHVLGFTDIDNKGIAGIEKYIDGQGLAALNGFGLHMTPDDLKPITLSLDLKVTQVVRDELARGIEKFKAKSGAAAIMDVNTGEVIALASLPDFDPNHPVDASDPDRINRLTVGVYEMGSTFKALSLAMALDSGKVTLNSRVDARRVLALWALHHSRFPRAASHADRAGGVHLFIEYRGGPHGPHGRGRRTQGFPCQDGSARSHCAPSCRRVQPPLIPKDGVNSIR